MPTTAPESPTAWISGVGHIPSRLSVIFVRRHANLTKETQFVTSGVALKNIGVFAISALSFTICDQRCGFEKTLGFCRFSVFIFIASTTEKKMTSAGEGDTICDQRCGFEKLLVFCHFSVFIYAASMKVKKGDIGW